MSRSTYFPTVPIDKVPHRFEFENSISGSEKHRPVVLVVDDERIIADTMSSIFSHSGFATMTAYDAASALEIAAVVPPELLITDVVMPGMSGVDLAIAMRQTVPDCEIIIFSGQASTMDLLAEARQAGHEFTALAKPVHPSVILAQAAERLHVRTQRSKRPIPISGPPLPEAMFCSGD